MQTLASRARKISSLQSSIDHVALLRAGWQLPAVLPSGVRLAHVDVHAAARRGDSMRPLGPGASGLRGASGVAEPGRPVQCARSPLCNCTSSFGRLANECWTMFIIAAFYLLVSRTAVLTLLAQTLASSCLLPTTAKLRFQQVEHWHTDACK